MDRNGFVSQVHRKKPQGQADAGQRSAAAMPAKSKVRAGVEHVFAEQKEPMDLFIRTIGIARAKMKIGLANLTYNIRRLVFHERTAAA